MILKCTCKHTAQDRLYGTDKRVHNEMKESGGTVSYRCTICNTERQAGPGSTKRD